MNGNDGMDILKTTLPPEDDKIDQALVELDTKLDAWAELILNTQAGLKNLASATNVQKPQEIGNLENANPFASENAGQNLSDLTCNSEVETSENIEPKNDTLLNIENLNEPEQPQSASPLSQEPAVAAEPAPVQDNHEEDEALLATLEPELVKKIQVLRRLTSKKRSVRELIEQVKAGASETPAPTENKKKSFWRR